jgi:hypothetical protein
MSKRFTAIRLTSQRPLPHAKRCRSAWLIKGLDKKIVIGKRGAEEEEEVKVTPGSQITPLGARSKTDIWCFIRTCQTMIWPWTIRRTWTWARQCPTRRCPTTAWRGRPSGCTSRGDLRSCAGRGILVCWNRVCYLQDPILRLPNLQLQRRRCM